MERREFLAALAVQGAGLGVGASMGAAAWQARAAANTVAEPIKPVRVLVWDEQQDTQVKSGAYKNFLGNAVADFLKAAGLEVTSANINEPEQGLSDSRIDGADVFVWWGHARHKDVDDSRVESGVAKVKAAKAGFVALHSSHFAKPFKALMGTGCFFRRVDSNNNQGFLEHLRVVNPLHAIAKGLKDFDIPKTEIYAEPFEVPMPDTVVLYGHWENGDSFPDCCCWTVGPKGVPATAKERASGGRVVYFRPGHETFPIFLQKEVQQVVTNAVRWAAPREA